MGRNYVACLALAFAATSCTAPAVVASPSPTVAPPATVPATPTITPSPSLRPVVTPTLPPATPQPTLGTLAGDRLIPFYFEIRPMFAMLPPSPYILPDLPPGTDENASFRGLNAQGQPQFAVRSDVVIDRGTAAHEIGHAYQKVLERMDPSRDALALYWAFRGFPGTWQQAEARSLADTSSSGRWMWSPQESWAEAFRAAVTLEVKERTLDYGKTIDPRAAREFFRSLASPRP